MIIGRVTGQFGKHRVRVQLRVPASLRGHAAQGRDRGLPQPRRGLDRSRQQPGAAAESPEATSTAGARLLRRAVLPQSGVLDDAGDQQAAARGRLHAVPLQADLRPSGAGRHHQPDPGDRAVERDQPGHRPARMRRWRTTATAACRRWGRAVGKTDGCQATASYVTGAHNMKVGYQGNRLDQLDKTIAEPDAARLPLQPGRAERGQLLAARLRPPHHHQAARLLRPGQLDASAG